MRQRALLTVITMTLLMGWDPTAAVSRPPRVSVLMGMPRHQVEVRLDLAGHRLIGKDTIDVAGIMPARLAFLLPSAKVLSVKARVLDGDLKSVATFGHELGVLHLAAPKETVEIEIRYVAEIHDKVKKSEDLTWVVGDDTSGVIDEQGVYLSPRSHWIPRLVGQRMAMFDITTVIPAPYLTVTQGSVPGRTPGYAPPAFQKTDLVLPTGMGRKQQPGEHAYTVSRAHAVIPTDSVYLAAGKYVTKSRKVDGVTLTTYFFEPNRAAMDLWLDEAAATVKRYAPILGKYPHPKFDIVSNFFQTGYGMPGWTLLGDRVISYVTAKARRMGNKIPPGYLDHEYAHGWYGNGLVVDYRTGNWCEAITTYYTNYLAKELASSAAGKAHRRGVLEKYAIRVNRANDYPLRQFVSKTEDKDNDIGYGKGSMLFHMLRNQVGDKVFFDTVADFTQEHIGEVVTWGDWFAAFSKASDQDIGAHIGPYLERVGLPTIGFKDFDLTQGADGQWTAQFAVSATSPDHANWPLDVPVRVTMPDRSVTWASVTANTGPMTLGGLEAKPARIELDPDFHLLRQIPAVDLPQCLNLTLERPQGTVFVENHAERFDALAGRIAENKGMRVAHEPATITGPSVVLSVDTSGKGVVIGGKRWVGDDLAVMRSSIENGHPVTRYVAFSAAAAARAGYATYYGWETWVVFQGGRPVARGIERGPETATRKLLAPLTGSGVAHDLAFLCAPEVEGRRPGTKGHARVEQWLAAQLAPLVGDARQVQFTRHAIDLAARKSSRELRIITGGMTQPFDNAFRPFAFTSIQKTTFELRAKAGPRGITLHTFDGTDPLALVAQLNASTDKSVLHAVVLSGPAKLALAPWLDTPSDLTEASKADLARPGRNGKPRARSPLDSWISGRRARGGLPRRLPHNVIAITPEAAAAIRAARTSDGEVRLAVHLAQIDPKRRAANVHAYLPAGNARAERPPVVVLMAHYDAMGKTNGAFYPGADDNASGVAAILEATRDLRAPFTADATRTVGLVVCFPDAEEWGLLGSRKMVDVLTKAYDVRAVINVDSVGRAITNPTFVLGITKHPALAKVVGDALGRQDLKPGRIIDMYAYAHGSDHWPFHEAGIPAISLWASDYDTMNTPADTLDKVEIAGIDKVATALRDLILNHLEGFAGK